MFSDLIEWWNGKLLQCTIVSVTTNLYTSMGGLEGTYTLVQIDETNERKYTAGNLGKPGDKIAVNSRKLWDSY